MSPPAVRLRPGTEADLEFLRRLHHAAMRPHVERAWGAWDEADQRRRFYDTTDARTHEIVLLDDEPVGCQWVREHDDAIELVRMYLMPAWQGRGIGTRLVAALRRRAAEAGLPLRLRVLRENPARRLYARLGFTETGETEWHVEMEAAPDAPLPPDAPLSPDAPLPPDALC